MALQTLRYIRLGAKERRSVCARCGLGTALTALTVDPTPATSFCPFEYTGYARAQSSGRANRKPSGGAAGSDP